MSYQLWSWLLTVVGVTGFVLAGRKVWWCWYINIGCQALWAAYAVISHQYGFIVAAAVYTVVFSQNAYKWTLHHKIDKYELSQMAKSQGIVIPACFCHFVEDRPHPWSAAMCPDHPIKE